MVVIQQEPIDVVVCTTNTPLATEACLRTLLYYNTDVDIRPTLRFPASCESWAGPLCQSLGIRAVRTEEQQSHEHGMTLAYKDSHSKLMLMLDSDVTFHGKGLIKELSSILNENSYAAGAEAKLGASWTGTHPRPEHWQAKEFTIPPRIPVHCLLIQKSETMNKLVGKFGFYCALMNGPDPGHYYDTAGLFGDVMEIAGWEYRMLYPDSRIKHWQSLSWMPDRCQKHSEMFEQMILDHTTATQKSPFHKRSQPI